MTPARLTRSLSALLGAVFLLSSSGSLHLLLLPESGLATHAICSDGIDNDRDGRVDYPQDPDCESLDDQSEGPTALFLTITDDRESVGPSGELVYAITLRQQREDFLLTDVTFHVPTQANITHGSDDAVFNGSTVVWRQVGIERGQTRRLSVFVNVNPRAREGDLIIARVIASDVVATDTTIVRGLPPAPLTPPFAVRVSDSHETVAPQEDLEYTIHVRNRSRDAQTTDVRVTIPSVLSVFGADAGGVREPGSITWTNVLFAPGEERVLRFRARVGERLPDFTHVRVRTQAGGVTASDTTVVAYRKAPHRFSIAITDDRRTAAPGMLLTYRVLVRNHDSRTMTQVAISASVPTYAEFISATEGGIWDGTNVRWRQMNVAPDGYRWLQYTLRLRTDAPLGRLFVTNAQSEGLLVSDEDLIVASVSMPQRHARVLDAEMPALVIPTVGSGEGLLRKVADRAEVMPGGRVRFTLTVRNILAVPLRDAVVSDRFHPQYLGVIDGGGASTSREGLLSWMIPPLLPGETWQTQYILQASENLPHGTILANTATLQSDVTQAFALPAKISQTRTAVITGLPETGAPLDVLLGLLLLPSAGTCAFIQRKLRSYAI